MDAQQAFIRPSRSLFLAPFGDGLAVYDPVTETAHILGPLESWIVTIDAPTVAADLVRQAAAESGVPEAEIEPRVVGAVTSMRVLGLLDRNEVYERPGPWRGSSRPSGGRSTGVAHSVAGERIAFRSSDRALLDAVDHWFGGGDAAGPAPKVIDIDAADDGGVTVFAADEWHFPDWPSFFSQLVHVVNEYAARVDSVVALHAGAVRTPDGRVLLLLDHESAGKAPLTAALVQAGCDYVSDETVAVRPGSLAVLGYPKPLTVNEEAWRLLDLPGPVRSHLPARELRNDVRLLGEDAGTVDEIIVTAYDPVPPGTVRRLDPADALKVLVTNTRNLGRVGAPGLRALCELAERVPVTQLTRDDDAIGLARELMAARADHPTAVPALRSHPLDSYRPRRNPDADHVAIDVDGHAIGFVRRLGRPVLVLDPLGAELWVLLDGSLTTLDLVERTVNPTRDGPDGWRAVVHQLWALQTLGLLDAPLAPWPTPEPADAWPRPSGPWTDSPRWLLARAERPVPLPGPILGEPRRWPQADGVVGDAVRLHGHLVVTNDASLWAALDPAVEAGVAQVVSPPSEPLSEREPLIRLRSLAGPASGSLIDFGGPEAFWVPPRAGIRVVACVLAGRTAAMDLPHSTPIPPVPVLTSGSRAVLHSGETPPSREGRRAGSAPERWERRFGALLHSGESIGIAIPDRAEDWLRRGASVRSAPEVMQSFDIAAIWAPGARSLIDAWADAAERLTSDRVGANRRLRQVVGGATTRIIAGGPFLPSLDGLDRTGPERLDGRASFIPTETISSTPIPPRKPNLSGPLCELAASGAEFCTARVVNESAKVDSRVVETGRIGWRVDITSSEKMTLVAQSRKLEAVFLRSGVSRDDAGDLAYLASAAGSFCIGEDLGASRSLRRRFYFTGFPDSAWERVARRWGATVPIPPGCHPSWLAWDVKATEPASTKYAVGVEALAGAPTIAEAVDAVASSMPIGWSDCIVSLADRMNIAMRDRPEWRDFLIVQSDGRHSIDLSVLNRWSEQPPGAIEPELRWLSAVAGHDNRAADRLVEWAYPGRITRLIFGTDGEDAPFVNLCREAAERRYP